MGCKPLGIVPVLIVVLSGFALAADQAADEVPFVEGQGPPPAKPGEGWCLVNIPATYRCVTEQVQIQPATFFMESIPARFETREETVMCQPETKKAICVPARFRTEKFQQLVKEATIKCEVIPAKYECVEEEVLVKQECDRLNATQARCRTETEQVLVAPARTYWRKEHGRNGQECYCLVEVPAKYITCTKQVLDQDAGAERVAEPSVTKKVKVWKKVKEAEVVKTEVPAEYCTLERQVLDCPAEVKYETIPAKYETIRKEVLVEPESQKRVEIPAKFETMTRKELDQPSRFVWRKIKCDSHDIVKKYKEVPGTDEKSLLRFRK